VEKAMRPKISQTAVTFTFVPFALLLSAALLAAERTESLDHSRLIYSSWVSLTFATPAVCLFIFPRTRNGDWELLTWTFSFVAYLVHFYYAFGLTYGWSFAATYTGQGVVIATSNFALTALWTFDVLSSWFGRRDGRWRQVERAAARLLVVVTFVASAVVIFGGFVRVLGVAMIAAVALSVIVRVVEVLRRRATERHANPLASGATAAH
jgi:hypothetical protein